MDVQTAATIVQASVLGERERSASAYRRFPDQMLFSCFIDLSGSSNYRLTHGPERGYIRSESFFSLIHEVIRPCSDISLVKEIGDEVLLVSPHFRSIFESLLMVDQVAFQLKLIGDEDGFPFAVRGSLGHGTVKRLDRSGVDYVGTSIDQLSRIMAVRSDSTNLLIHEDCYRNSKDIVDEYGSVVSVGDPIALRSETAKALTKHVLYREIRVNRNELNHYDDYFAGWLEND